jgi:two-component system, NarL family, response regulator NreC
MPIRVLLAEDHLIVRQGLRLLLEKEKIQVVGEAADGHEAIRQARELVPDIAILDFEMPNLNGVDAVREIVRANPKIRCIILTRHMEEPYALEALRAGARGYILKTQAPQDIVTAVLHVNRGEVYLSPKVSRAVVEAYLAKRDLPDDPLTARERQVLQLVGEGKSTKEIASVLCISVKTADTHRTKIMQKLDIHQVAGLVRYAIRQGLIVP